MYVIKHHNKFQSDMPSHIREMAKESYLKFFAKRRLGADADARVIALALKSRRAKNDTNCLPTLQSYLQFLE